MPMNKKNDSNQIFSRYETIVDDYPLFIKTCNAPLPRVARVNTIKTTLPRVISIFSNLSIEATQSEWNPLLFQMKNPSIGNTLPHFLGWIHGQEEVSNIPPIVLDPSPGDIVWDACSSPGSKTSQLASIMKDKGIIVANDSNLRRIPALRSNLERLGVTIAAVTHSDARHFSMKPFAFDHFDSALVDVPCSGEGTIRKNPAALKNWSINQLLSLQKLQISILKRAIETVKSGGTVVYSTCTFSPEENEAVLDEVLIDGKCSPVKFDSPLPSSPGVTEWCGNSFDPRVKLAKRIWPHYSNTGGFFIAKLKVI
mgnify:CR=1 FL=1